MTPRLDTTAGVLDVCDPVAVTRDLRIEDGGVLRFGPGGLLDIGDGVTVHIGGRVEAGLGQIFTGAGRVVFRGRAQDRICPQWWGGVGSEHIQAAIDSVDVEAGVVHLVAGNYNVTTPVQLRDHVTVVGDPGATILHVRAESAFRQEPGTVLRHCTLRNLTFTTDTHPHATVLALGTIQHSVVQDLHAAGFAAGTLLRLHADAPEQDRASATGNTVQGLTADGVAVGLDISGCPDSWVTGNVYRDVTLRGVCGIGIAFRSYCDHERFYNITIRLAADGATGVAFNCTPTPQDFSYVYMNSFYGLTLITNVKDTNDQIGLLFANTRGHLLFGLSFGSHSWRGTRIVDHGNQPGLGDNSYLAIGTNSWELDGISTWRKHSQTDRTGTATLPAGADQVDVPHGLCDPPARVFVTPTTDPGPRSYWVSQKGRRHFRFVASAVSTRSLTFDWKAQVDDG